LRGDIKRDYSKTKGHVYKICVNQKSRFRRGLIRHTCLSDIC
jgi:hypothetical protein